MSPEIVNILVGFGSSLTTLIAAYLVYRAQKKSAQAQADEAIATSASKISETAIDQINYIAKANEELRVQKCELEKAVEEAKRNHAEALRTIERIESEYRLAVDELVAKHLRVQEELSELKDKYNHALQEIAGLKVKIAIYEKNERKVSD